MSPEGITPYFTPEERLPLLRLSRRIAGRNLLTRSDIAYLRLAIAKAVDDGSLARDAQGFNPTMHSLEVADLFCRLIAPDRHIVAATLLSDLLRVGAIMPAEVARQFDDDTLRLVTGLVRVTKLYDRRAAVTDENFQKLTLAFADDIRVIIIMIIDRLSLMRQINHHPDETYVHEISNEARYLYAPLAHRLGLYAIKSELEDLSLKYLNRRVYTQIAQKLNETKTSRDRYVADFIAPLKDELQKAGLRFEIKGRTKTINSIWNKMTKQGVDLNGIFDLFAIRIILDSRPEDEKKDCWVAFSIVTDMYTANTHRLRDWITIPKSNGYESLHITVNGPDGKWVEVQIRTRRMDEVAERGLAAHWRYKGIKSEHDLDQWITGVREVLETGSEGQMEMIRAMNRNIYDKEVFVFTPRGDLFRLPQGATVLDFAFAVHSRVGSTCTGARVNGKPKRISHRLRNGDTVEVLTSSTQSPKQDWLAHVVTGKARNKIRQALNEHRARQADMGREMLQRRFKNRKREIDEATLSRMVSRMGYKTMTDFFVAINEETVDINTIIEAYDNVAGKTADTTEHTSAEQFVLHATDATGPRQSSSDILIIGDDIKGLNYRLSKCCAPIYGDRIVGFVASDGAIKIHRANCPNLRHLQQRYPYRIIQSAWSGKIGQQLAATLRVVGKDDIGIVSNITSMINKTPDTQLRNISISGDGMQFEGILVVAVPSLSTLDELIGKISTLRGVKHVERSQ